MKTTKYLNMFIFYSNPTPDTDMGFQWMPVEAHDNDVHTRYLEIGEKLVMKEENLKRKQADFWDQLQRRYQNVTFK